MPSSTSRVAEPALNNARKVSPSTPIHRSTSAPAKRSSTPSSFLIPPRITSSQSQRSNATARPTSSLSASSPSPPVRALAARSPTNQLLLHAMSALTVLVSTNPTGRALVVTVDPSLHQLLSHLTTVTIALNELLALPMAHETGSALMAKMARLADTQVTVLSAALTLLSRSRVASSAGVGVGSGSCGATRTCMDQEATNRMAAPAPTLVPAETVPARTAAPATTPSVARVSSVPPDDDGLDLRHPLTTPDAARIVLASPGDGGSDARQPFTTPIGQLTMLSAASPAHRSSSRSQSRSSTEPDTHSRASLLSTSRSSSPTQLPLPSRFSHPPLPSVPIPGPKLEHLKSDPAQGAGNEPNMLLLDNTTGTDSFWHHSIHDQHGASSFSANGADT
ncbi:hypothetical protein GGF31_001387 [Allomyces arbusculus]|nr:hypothetical protein GGF31_001387 [Allomyces arbusculus]